MLLINLIITMIAAWIINWLIFGILQPAIWDSKRFKLFELRDKLALLAMQGKVKEESEEYILLRTLINKSIHLVSDFDVPKLFEFVKEAEGRQEIEKKIDNIFDTLLVENREFAMIVSNYFWIMYVILHPKIRLLKRIMRSFIFFLDFIWVIPKTIIKTLTSWEYMIKAADDDLKRTRNRYSLKAAN